MQNRVGIKSIKLENSRFVERMKTIGKIKSPIAVLKNIDDGDSVMCTYIHAFEYVTRRCAYLDYWLPESRREPLDGIEALCLDKDFNSNSVCLPGSVSVSLSIFLPLSLHHPLHEIWTRQNALSCGNYTRTKFGDLHRKSDYQSQPRWMQTKCTIMLLALVRDTSGSCILMIQSCLREQVTLDALFKYLNNANV